MADAPPPMGTGGTPKKAKKSKKGKKSKKKSSGGDLATTSGGIKFALEPSRIDELKTIYEGPAGPRTRRALHKTTVIITNKTVEVERFATASRRLVACRPWRAPECHPIMLHARHPLATLNSLSLSLSLSLSPPPPPPPPPMLLLPPLPSLPLRAGRARTWR